MSRSGLVGPRHKAPTAEPELVPIVDISAFSGTGAVRREAVVDAVRVANETVGFLVVTGHGVPGGLVADIESVSRRFFTLPLEQKLRYSPSRPEVSRGYMPPRSRALARSRGEASPPDLVEYFAVGNPSTPDRNFETEDPFGVHFAPNVWPGEPVGFEAAWTRYYISMEDLATRLMHIFAAALGLPDEHFDASIDRHCSNLFANYYPAVNEDPEPGQLRLGAHTDYGSLTIVHQDDSPTGLQVRSHDSWVDVPVVPHTFVVNIGDLMARWTNDRWVSTLHRVVVPPAERRSLPRLSIPFFHQPNQDAVIQCLPGCSSSTSPARYAPITSGENMVEKTRRSLAASVSEPL